MLSGSKSSARSSDERFSPADLLAAIRDLMIDKGNPEAHRTELTKKITSYIEQKGTEGLDTLLNDAIGFNRIDLVGLIMTLGKPKITSRDKFGRNAKTSLALLLSKGRYGEISGIDEHLHLVLSILQGMPPPQYCVLRSRADAASRLYDTWGKWSHHRAQLLGLIINYLDDSDVVVRRYMTHILAEKYGNEMLAPMLLLTNDEDSSVSYAAMKFLAKCDHPIASDFLFHSVVAKKIKPSTMIINHLIQHGRLQKDEFYASVLQNLAEFEIEIIHNAIEETDNIELLLPLLSIDGDHKLDERTTKKLARKLAALGDLRAVEPLITRLAHEDNLAVISALGKLGDASAIAPITQVLERTGDDDVKEAAIKVLGELGTREELPTLRKFAGSRCCRLFCCCTGDTNKEVRASANEAIRDITMRQRQPPIQAQQSQEVAMEPRRV